MAGRNTVSQREKQPGPDTRTMPMAVGAVPPVAMAAMISKQSTPFVENQGASGAATIREMPGAGRAASGLDRKVGTENEKAGRAMCPPRANSWGRKLLNALAGGFLGLDFLGIKGT